MAKYNEVAELIGGLTHDAYNIPRLSGLGFTIPVAAITVIVASVAVSWAVVAYSNAWSDTTAKQTALELAKLEYVKLNPQNAAMVFSSLSKTLSSASGDWGDYFNRASGNVVQSALTVGGIGLVLYFAYKLIRR